MAATTSPKFKTWRLKDPCGAKTVDDLRDTLYTFIEKLPQTQSSSKVEIKQLNIAQYDGDEWWATITFNCDELQDNLMEKFKLDKHFLGLTPLVGSGKESIE